MSLLTGQYFEVQSEDGFNSHCNGLKGYGLGAAPVKHKKRRFFQGNASWEEDVQRGINARVNGGAHGYANGIGATGVNGDRRKGLLVDTMSRGGRNVFDDEEWDEDVQMSSVR